MVVTDNEPLKDIAYWSYWSELRTYLSPEPGSLYTDYAAELCHHYGFVSLNDTALLLESECVQYIEYLQVTALSNTVDSKLPPALYQKLRTKWKPIVVQFQTNKGLQKVYIRFHNDEAGTIAATYFKLLVVHAEKTVSLSNQE